MPIFLTPSLSVEMAGLFMATMLVLHYFMPQNVTELQEKRIVFYETICFTFLYV
jgi:hypothetical protein